MDTQGIQPRSFAWDALRSQYIESERVSDEPKPKPRLNHMATFIIMVHEATNDVPIKVLADRQEALKTAKVIATQLARRSCPVVDKVCDKLLIQMEDIRAVSVHEHNEDGTLYARISHIPHKFEKGVS